MDAKVKAALHRARSGTKVHGDTFLLRNAFIAEHPADDDVRAEKDWLETIGFTEHVSNIMVLSVNGYTFSVIVGSNEISISRGRVRRLISALKGEE